MHAPNVRCLLMHAPNVRCFWEAWKIEEVTGLTGLN